MKPNLAHIFINVSNPKVSFSFYKTVLGFLGYKVEFENEDQIGLNNGSTEIWLRPAQNSGDFNYDRNKVGLNHLAIRVENMYIVNSFHREILETNEIKTLYNSPRIFPDFTDDYYAVYFEDPDGIKLEVTSYTFEFET